MPNLHISALPTELKPLADKFYRAQRSPMRRQSDAQVWVVQPTAIVAALCLRPVAHGHWLTSLLVAPEHRRQGLAQRLIAQALEHTPGPVWLFCQPGLLGFYQQQGFEPCHTLPVSLRERLERYQRHKPLLALSRNTSSNP